MQNNEFYLNRCIKIAKKGIGKVSPNPLVGCVIINNNEIIGEGYHENYGDKHAEVNAINNVKNKDQLKTSTLFVNLEPCCHHGKTPPCVDLIIKYKIPNVVIGSIDPFSKVQGKGIDKMREYILSSSVYNEIEISNFDYKSRNFLWEHINSLKLEDLCIENILKIDSFRAVMKIIEDQKMNPEKFYSIIRKYREFL